MFGLTDTIKEITQKALDEVTVKLNDVENVLKKQRNYKILLTIFFYTDLKKILQNFFRSIYWGVFFTPILFYTKKFSFFTPILFYTKRFSFLHQFFTTKFEIFKKKMV